MQIGFVGLGKIGRPMAIRVETAVRELWDRDIIEEALRLTQLPGPATSAAGPTAQVPTPANQ